MGQSHRIVNINKRDISDKVVALLAAAGEGRGGR